VTIVVPRHDEFRPFGTGLIKGLLVTMAHFIRSYGKRNLRIPGKEPFPGGRFGLFTVQYCPSCCTTMPRGLSYALPA
jgi:hypothetical protein